MVANSTLNGVNSRINTTPKRVPDPEEIPTETATTANATSVTGKVILLGTAGVAEETEEGAEAVLATVEEAETAAIPVTTAATEAEAEATTATEEADAAQGQDPPVPDPEATPQEIGGETVEETGEMTAEMADVATAPAVEEVIEIAETVEEATGDAETPPLVRTRTVVTDATEPTEIETPAHRTMAPEELTLRPGLPVRVRNVTIKARTSQTTQRKWKPRTTTKPPSRRRSPKLLRQRAQPKQSQPKTRTWPIQKKKSECE